MSEPRIIRKVRHSDQHPVFAAAVGHRRFVAGDDRAAGITVWGRLDDSAVPLFTSVRTEAPGKVWALAISGHLLASGGDALDTTRKEPRRPSLDCGLRAGGQPAAAARPRVAVPERPVGRAERRDRRQRDGRRRRATTASSMCGAWSELGRRGLGGAHCIEMKRRHAGLSWFAAGRLLARDTHAQRQLGGSAARLLHSCGASLHTTRQLLVSARRRQIRAAEHHDHAHLADDPSARLGVRARRESPPRKPRASRRVALADAPNRPPPLWLRRRRRRRSRRRRRRLRRPRAARSASTIGCPRACAR